MRDFKCWLVAVKPTLLPSEPLAAAINYYNKHGTALFRFVDDPLVPIDNSPTEREFQNVAKLRLNMLFAGSTEGAHRACVLLGTWQRTRRPCRSAFSCRTPRSLVVLLGSRSFVIDTLTFVSLGEQMPAADMSLINDCSADGAGRCRKSVVAADRYRGAGGAARPQREVYAGFDAFVVSWVQFSGSPLTAFFPSEQGST